MSARPTSADVLRIIDNDDTMRDAARAAAVLAMDEIRSDGYSGSIGARVRLTLPKWLDDALGAGDLSSPVDPTGEIGQAFYPREVGHVTGRESLDSLPVGALIVDRDGYVLVKEEWQRGASEYGTEYRVLYSPDSPERGAVFAADELAGDYAEPGSGSSFLPGRAYMIGGDR